MYLSPKLHMWHVKIESVTIQIQNGCMNSHLVVSKKNEMLCCYGTKMTEMCRKYEKCPFVLEPVSKLIFYQHSYLIVSNTSRHWKKLDRLCNMFPLHLPHVLHHPCTINMNNCRLVSDVVTLWWVSWKNLRSFGIHLFLFIPGRPAVSFSRTCT